MALIKYHFPTQYEAKRSPLASPLGRTSPVNARETGIGGGAGHGGIKTPTLVTSADDAHTSLTSVKIDEAGGKRLSQGELSLLTSANGPWATATAPAPAASVKPASKRQLKPSSPPRKSPEKSVLTTQVCVRVREREYVCIVSVYSRQYLIFWLHILLHLLLQVRVCFCVCARECLLMYTHAHTHTHSVG